MMMRQHRLAATTPATKAYIQSSPTPASQLVRELGVSYNTVTRWRGRQEIYGRSHRPHRIATTLTAEEQHLTIELRRCLALSLDDITEVLRRCVNPKLSHKAIHCCLRRYAVSCRSAKPAETPASGWGQAPACGAALFCSPRFIRLAQRL
jgi:hypothetical protein